MSAETPTPYAPQSGRYRITAAAQRPKPTPNAPQSGRYRMAALSVARVDGLAAVVKLDKPNRAG